MLYNCNDKQQEIKWTRFWDNRLGQGLHKSYFCWYAQAKSRFFGVHTNKRAFRAAWVAQVFFTINSPAREN